MTAPTNIIEQRKDPPVLGFQGIFNFLSNFYDASVDFEGLTYRNSEAAYQAAKTLNLKDRERFTQMSPHDAKKAGRTVELRPDWEQVKVDVMRTVLLSKFTKHKKLMERLKGTGDSYLEETNDWGDKIWGVVNGEGQNLLGKLLMDLRDSQAVVPPTPAEEPKPKAPVVTLPDLKEGTLRASVIIGTQKSIIAELQKYFGAEPYYILDPNDPEATFEAQVKRLVENSKYRNSEYVYGMVAYGRRFTDEELTDEMKKYPRDVREFRVQRVEIHR